jgi:hypothetical protein
MNKTIILLSAKRCGTTALFKMMREHSGVNFCSVTKNPKNWEPGFWNNGNYAIRIGRTDRFIKRFQKNYSYLNVPHVTSEQILFDLWDEVLENRGPVVFDKSPQYLGSRGALNLILKYKAQGRDVRVIGLIRDPRDAITSQFRLWGGVYQKKTGNKDTLRRREVAWLLKYKNLEYVQSVIPDMLMMRYENFVNYPELYLKQMCEYCDISYYPYTHRHIKPVNIGRYKRSSLSAVKNWEFSEEFKRHLLKYGYKL